jgi:uncharacterized protein YodC (DUF2158 family)
MKLGEVVQLKSGGPLMTVQTYQPEHCLTLFGHQIERKAYVICEWYDDETKDYVTDRFLPEQLQVVPSLSHMSFKELKAFEIEATARRINK